MKFTIISDTHGEQEKLGVLSGDVLIQCVDMFSMFGRDNDDFDRMDDWFGKQQFDFILCVGDNHDFELEKRSLYTDKPFNNAVYLEGTSLEYHGLKIHGAPWIPELRGRAFFKEESELSGCWSAIPEGVDVLITHTCAWRIPTSSRYRKLK